MQVLHALSEGLAFRVLQEVADVGTLCSCLTHCTGRTIALGMSQFSAPEFSCSTAFNWRAVCLWPQSLWLREVSDNAVKEGLFRLAPPPEQAVITMFSGGGGAAHVVGGALHLGKAACLIFDNSCADTRLEGVSFKGVQFPSVVMVTSPGALIWQQAPVSRI